MRKTCTALIAAALLLPLGSAQADGLGITSQFGFTGWPYRQTPACQQTCAPEACETPACPKVDCEVTASPTPECTDMGCVPTPAPESLQITTEPTTEATSIPTEEPSSPTPVTTSPLTPSPIPTEAPTPAPSKAPAPTPTRAVTPAPTHTPVTGSDYTTVSVSAQEQNIFLLLNSDRITNGLPALTLDPTLSAIARRKSEDMRDNHYFAHESPTWGKAASMLTAFGYPYSAVGENIAHHATPEKAEVALMNSDGHRRNILGKTWTKVGVGICFDEHGYVYVTQLFVR